MRILIIEDQPDLLIQLEQALLAENYVVDLADNGELAQYLGANESYDAIILDFC